MALKFVKRGPDFVANVKYIEREVSRQPAVLLGGCPLRRPTGSVLLGAHVASPQVATANVGALPFVARLAAPQIVNQLKLKHPLIIALHEVGGQRVRAARCRRWRCTRRGPARTRTAAALLLQLPPPLPPVRTCRLRADGHKPPLRPQVFLTDSHLVLAMEYAAGGDLLQFITHRRFLKEEEARWFFQQVALAVHYSHGMVGGLGAGGRAGGWRVGAHPCCQVGVLGAAGGVGACRLTWFRGRRGVCARACVCVRCVARPRLCLHGHRPAPPLRPVTHPPVSGREQPRPQARKHAAGQQPLARSQGGQRWSREGWGLGLGPGSGAWAWGQRCWGAIGWGQEAGGAGRGRRRGRRAVEAPLPADPTPDRSPLLPDRPTHAPPPPARPQLADWGLSKDTDAHSLPKTRVGTPAYLAPEIVRNMPGQPYDGQVGRACGPGTKQRPSLAHFS